MIGPDDQHVDGRGNTARNELVLRVYQFCFLIFKPHTVERLVRHENRAHDTRSLEFAPRHRFVDGGKRDLKELSVPISATIGRN